MGYSIRILSHRSAQRPDPALYSVAIVALFTGFLFYDFSNIRHECESDDHVLASIALYLEFINLF